MRKALAVTLSICLLLITIPISVQATNLPQMKCIQGEVFSLYEWLDVAKLTSSNPKVMKVKNKHTVAAKKPGTATLTITLSDKSKYKCKVKVYSNKVLDKLDIDRYDSPTEGAIYKITNNTGLDLDVKYEVVRHMKNGDDEADEFYIGTLPKKASYIYCAGIDVDNTSFQVFANTLLEEVKQIKLTENIKSQSNDVYFTAKNNKSKLVTYSYGILGFDEDNNVVFVQSTLYDYINPNSTYRVNMPYTYKESWNEEIEDTIEIPNIPVRYEIYSYAYCE